MSYSRKADIVFAIPEPSFPFERIEIHKHNRLGQGSYGYVCKGKCDKLPCAAKLLHSLFFTCQDPGIEDILRKFTEECQLLRTLSHPNIVQFIGVCRLGEEEGRVPVLLTELMDESLMNFITRSHESHVTIPYHVEVNLLHDVALALSYLHSKNIIHRDLSSNNVLLLAGSKAKVTDFGVAKLHDLQTQYNMTKYLTSCPGTPVFMPPEASDSQYTTKLDIFSWAVISLHLLSKNSPSPLPPTTKETDQLGRDIFVPIPEKERRANDINLINPDHYLLPITKRALNDKPNDRPTANDLCDQLENLKTGELYSTSVQQPTPREMELTKKFEEASHQVTKLQQELFNLKARLNEESVHNVVHNNQTMSADIDLPLIERLKSVEEENKTLRAKLDNQHAEIQRLQSCSSTDSDTSNTSSLHNQELFQTGSYTKPLSSGSSSGPFHWKTVGDAPCLFARGSITSIGDKVYISRPKSTVIYIYNTTFNTWSTLVPTCPIEDFTLVQFTGKLLAVGGVKPDTKQCSNNIYALDIIFRDQAWSKNYINPMYYARAFPAVVAFDPYLVVTGGSDYTNVKTPLDYVEIYDSTKSQWFTAYSLPTPLTSPVAVVNAGEVYVVGGVNKEGHSATIYHCSLTFLYQWSSRLVTPVSMRQTWKSIHCPIASPAAVTINDQLFLVGGIMGEEDGYPEISNNIFKYKAHKQNFSISVMPHARGSCLATVLPGNNGIIVVGGCGTKVVDIGMCAV